MNIMQEEEKLGKIYDARIVKRLWQFVGKEKYFIFIAGFIGIVLTLTQILIPFLVRIAIDRYIINTYQLVKIKESQAINYKKFLIPLKENLYLVRTVDAGKIHEGEIKKEVYFMFKKEVPEEKRIKPDIMTDKFILVKAEKIRKAPSKILKILRSEDLKGLSKIAMIFLSIIIFRFFISFLQIFLMEYAGQRTMHRLRIKVFSHLLRMPVSFFDKNPTGRLVTRNTNDVEAINQLFTEVMTSLFRDVFMLTGIIIFLPFLSLRLALATYAIVPPLVIITFVFRKRIREAYRAVRKALARINTFLQESIQGIKVIQLFTREKKRYQEFEHINHEYYLANFRQILIFAVFRPLIDFIAMFTTAMIIFVGAHGVIGMWVSIGTVVAFLSYVEYFFEPIRDLSEKFNLMQSAMAAGERIFKLLDTPQEDYKGIRLSRIRGEIEFERVWFAYNDEEYVLRDISFKIRPGEKIAFVGATGAGKTTIINLLCRFYEVTKGRILLDGVDIKKLDKDFLRSHIGIVTQDVFIFAGDIKDNIKLRSEIGIKEVKKAVSVINAHRFIERRKKGYKEEIKERGANLSVGERQLIALARAIAFNPKILVLDEATSSIDPKTENLVQQGIKKLTENRTSLIIAHRLSTIKNADRIIVIHDGRIVEEGTHEELIKKKGVYYNLYRLQFTIEPQGYLL